MELEGKTAVVTGAGQGVGRGIAVALAKAGADVAVLELHTDTGEAVAAELRALGRRAFARRTDVRRAADCEAGVAAAIDELGGVDVLVNNAQQVRPYVRMIDVTDDDMLATWESGTLATFRLMKLVYPSMCERGGGAIVNLGSGAGTDGMPGFAAYASAKEGIRALTKVAAREWGRDGIRVNTICPYANSPYWESMPEDVRAQRVREIPLRRIGDCEADVGGTVVFLASAAGSYVTGQTIMVDGGNVGFR